MSRCPPRTPYRLAEHDLQLRSRGPSVLEIIIVADYHIVVGDMFRTGRISAIDCGANDRIVIVIVLIIYWLPCEIMLESNIERQTELYLSGRHSKTVSLMVRGL